MACVLYDNNGEMILCKISEVDYYIQRGYLKDDPATAKPESALGEITSKLEELENDLSVNEEEIRALARARGIARVGKKNIDTLLRELEAQEDAPKD